MMELPFQLGIVYLMTLTQLTALPAPSTECDMPTDVVFLVDTSSSIWPHDFFTHVLPFLSEVVNMFDIGPASTQTRVGVTTFSSTHRLQFHLGDFLDKELLMKEIQKIPFNGGNTNTADALNYVTSEMFTEARGSRSDVPHIIVILTDGASQDFRSTQEAAQRAHREHFQVFAIGVGSGIDNVELEELASDPDDDFKFKVTNFQALMKIKGRLAKKTCQISTPRPPVDHSTTPLTMSTSSVTTTTTKPTSTSSATTTSTSATTTTAANLGSMDLTHSFESGTSDYLGDEEIRTQICGGKPADVYFILDSSGSIEKDDFSKKTLDFVRSVTGLFDIGPGRSQTRVGIVTFSDDFTQIFPLNAHTSREDLLNAISPENIPHLAQGTNTAAAIRFVQEEGFSPEVARPGVAHVAIVITDGQSKDTEATLEAARHAHTRGTFLFAIGVGKSIDSQELRDIGSNPDSQFVFTVDDFSALSRIQSLLAIRTCGVGLSEDFQLNDEQAACGLDNAELVFVFDSFSMGREATRLILHEVGKISSSLSYDVENLASGMISESCPSKLDIPLLPANKLARKSMRIQEAAKSKLPNLMKEVRRKWFSRDQTAGRQVMVLVVNEASLDNAEDLLSQSRYARHTGQEVFVVAIGKVNSKLVAALASEPRDDHVIRVPNAEHLLNYRKGIIENLCADTNFPSTRRDKSHIPSFP